MKIFVSGGSGFIGSSLVDKLVRKRYEVTNYDIVPPKYINGAENILADILDYGKLIRSMKGHDMVYHLAARPYIPDGYMDPQGMVMVDMVGTLNMLLAAKKVGIKHFVHFSSSEVYGSEIYSPMDENHPTNPISTYAVAKLGADRLVHTFGHEQKLPFTVLRQFNVIGERDTHHRIVPYIVSEMVKGNTKIKIGNPNSRRDFTYVEDVADACYRVINNEKALWETINIGTGVTYNGYDIMATVIEIIKGAPQTSFVIDRAQFRPLDVDTLCADNTKAAEILNWAPTTKFYDAVEKIVKWRKNHVYSWEGYYDKI